jgi:hypothetical protein
VVSHLLNEVLFEVFKLVLEFAWLDAPAGIPATTEAVHGGTSFAFFGFGTS